MNRFGLGNLNPELPEEDRAEDDETVDVVREALRTLISWLCLDEWSAVRDLDIGEVLHSLSPVGNRCRLSCPKDSVVPPVTDVPGVAVVVARALPSLRLPLLLLLIMLLSDIEDWE